MVDNVTFTPSLSWTVHVLYGPFKCKYSIQCLQRAMWNLLHAMQTNMKTVFTLLLPIIFLPVPFNFGHNYMFAILTARIFLLEVHAIKVATYCSHELVPAVVRSHATRVRKKFQRPFHPSRSRISDSKSSIFPSHQPLPHLSPLLWCSRIDAMPPDFLQIYHQYLVSVLRKGAV